ncbi:MAG: hypothetical protein ABIT76_11590 [Chthoniobacterales bacterium]
MSHEARILFQTLFTVGFVVTLLAAVWLVKNDQKLFGHNPDIPGDHASGRTYNKTMVWAIWAHVAVLTGAFALYLH